MKYLFDTVEDHVKELGFTEVDGMSFEGLRCYERDRVRVNIVSTDMHGIIPAVTVMLFAAPCPPFEIPEVLAERSFAADVLPEIVINQFIGHVVSMNAMPATLPDADGVL